MAPLHFVIQFDRDRDEESALALARRLFARFDERIDSLALVPVEDGEFALLLDGHLVHSLRASGRAPRVADIVALLSET